MLARYFTFEGRATRKQYWLFVLAFMGAGMVAGTFDAFSFSRIDFSDPARINPLSLLPVFSIITLLAFLVPSICVSVRRLHDRDKSGWFYLLLFIPVIGLWPLVEISFLPGTYGPNRFGPDPLGGAPAGHGYPAPQHYYGGQDLPPPGYPPQQGYPQQGHSQQSYPPPYDSQPPQGYPPQSPQGR